MLQILNTISIGGCGTLESFKQVMFYQWFYWISSYSVKYSKITQFLTLCHELHILIPIEMIHIIFILSLKLYRTLESYKKYCFIERFTMFLPVPRLCHNFWSRGASELILLFLRRSRRDTSIAYIFSPLALVLRFLWLCWNSL